LKKLFINKKNLKTKEKIMDAIQENRVSMFFKTRLFFTNHQAVLATAVPAFTNAILGFNTKLDQLGALDQTATEANNGYATQKQINRTDMTDKALAIANGIKALALINGDMVLSAKVATVKSTLDRMRDVDALYWCENLATIATANATAIIPMGITAAKLTSYAAAVAKYKQSLQTPADQRSESLAAGLAVESKIIECNVSLDILDALMETQRIDQTMLYNKYQADRAIDDNATNQTAPDVTLTIDPGFKVIYTVPYNVGRSFRLRNRSAETINFGLSNNIAAFEELATKLLANGDTTKQSMNIGTKGDNFLIENPSNASVEIDLWVVE
jgi:hypothetical protein